MNRTLAVVSALSVGLSTAVFTGSAMAQAGAPAAPAAAAPAVKPEAIPAKIAVLNFEAAVAGTNEGQAALQELQKKYGPQQQRVQSEATEVDQLRKQADALPATTPDTEKQARLATIDAKEKQLNLDAETLQNTSGAEMQDVMGKIAQKVSPVVTKYLQQSGFTMMLSVGGQQSDVMWYLPQTDITQAVIDAYNASSGVAAPLPAAPAAGTTPRPRTPSTAPKPAAK